MDIIDSGLVGSGICRLVRCMSICTAPCAFKKKDDVVGFLIHVMQCVSALPGPGGDAGGGVGIGGDHLQDLARRHGFEGGNDGDDEMGAARATEVNCSIG